MQPAELRMEEDEHANGYAEGRQADEDLPRSDPTGFPEDCRDDQSDNRATDGKRRSHSQEDSLDLPAVDPLDPIRAAVHLRRRELDRPLLRDLGHRRRRSSSAPDAATVTSS